MSPRKGGATLKYEFLGLVHCLQAEGELDTAMCWWRIPFIFRAHLHARSHGHTWYTLLSHATKVILLAHNLKYDFVLIEILVYLFSA